MTTARTLPSILPESFRALSEILPLRPIQNDVDLDYAQVLADHLAVLDRRTKGQDEYLETLSILIEKYEDKHHAIDTQDLEPLETLKFLLGQHDMNASDLGRLLGQRQVGAKILSGDRQLSKTHIARLSAHFRISAAAFLKPQA